MQWTDRQVDEHEQRPSHQTTERYPPRTPTFGVIERAGNERDDRDTPPPQYPRAERCGERHDTEKYHGRDGERLSSDRRCVSSRPFSSFGK